MAAPEASLEALVRDELRGPVSELVRRLVPELVAEALNDPQAATHSAQTSMNGSDPASEYPVASADRKTCRECGRQDVTFDRGRRVCRRCRSQQVGERKARAAQATDDDP